MEQIKAKIHRRLARRLKIRGKMLRRTDVSEILFQVFEPYKVAKYKLESIMEDHPLDCSSLIA
jgi:hypothetical protein